MNLVSFSHFLTHFFSVAIFFYIITARIFSQNACRKSDGDNDYKIVTQTQFVRVHHPRMPEAEQKLIAGFFEHIHSVDTESCIFSIENFWEKKKSLFGFDIGAALKCLRLPGTGLASCLVCESRQYVPKATHMHAWCIPEVQTYNHSQCQWFTC